VQLVKQEFGDNFDVVYPKISILAESPVAVIDKVVDKLGNRKQATAYLQFLYSEQGQDIIAKHYLRPRSEAAAKNMQHRSNLSRCSALKKYSVAGNKSRKNILTTVPSLTRFIKRRNKEVVGHPKRQDLGVGLDVVCPKGPRRESHGGALCAFLFVGSNRQRRIAAHGMLVG